MCVQGARVALVGEARDTLEGAIDIVGKSGKQPTHGVVHIGELVGYDGGELTHFLQTEKDSGIGFTTWPRHPLVAV
jgi:hypothetical protein